MKVRTALSSIAVVLIWSVWYFGQQISFVSGKVESEIQGFGPQLAGGLEQGSTFNLTAKGYEPKPEPPRAPAGLKPVELQAWTAMAQRNLGEAALVPTFPEHYSDGTQVRSQGMAVTLKPLGSTTARARIENGKLVYHNAYKLTDSLNVVSDGRSEEFLLLHDANAPQRFEYDISTLVGVTDISLSDNSIHFKNAQGQQLQIEAPWLVETGGQKETDAVHWQLSYPNGQTRPRLALVVANAGKLHYPVVIDPTWVVTNGSLTTGRYEHTATLLTNGLVLLAGGFNPTYLTSAELYNPATGTFSVTGSLNFARAYHTATLLPNGQVLVAGGQSPTPLTSAELYNPATGTWTVTASLNFARSQHTATLLPNGQVLLAGGASSSANPASTELYNPATGIWTATGNLNTPRYDHTATLLPNGQVLVAAGYSIGALVSAELYNPSTGLWTFTGSLHGARYQFNSTLLANGTVLAEGGYGGSSILATAEIYSPTAGTWATTTSMPVARYNHTSTLLPNGQVLVAGGLGNSGYLASTALYNPTAGTWATGSNLNTSRWGHTATLLPSGVVLVTAGDGALTSAELYDPSAGTFTTTGSLHTARQSQTATLLPNGQVLVAGGYNSGVLASAELFNPATGAWTVTGSLNNARFYHTATLLPNGQVLAAGGLGSSFSSITSAELYNPTTGLWTTTGNLSTDRYYHTATLLPNGQVLVAGGNSSTLGYLTSAELYNPATGAWTATGSLNNARDNHTATLLPNGDVLAAGGYNGSSYLTSAELYSPATGMWTATGSLNVGRCDHTATLLPNGQVLLAGGESTSYLNSAELYNPATGTCTTTGNLNAARGSHTATLLPNGNVLAAGGYNGSSYPTSAELYSPATGMWTVTGSLSTARWQHSATLLPNGQVLVAGGVKTADLASAELFNPGLGYTSTTQPQLSTVSSVNSGSALSLTGTNFTGISEASGGASNNSATNIPVVQLESLANEQVINVPLDPSQGFSSTSYVSLPPTGLVPGYALLTMFVNGTPSLSQIVSYSSGVAPVITSNAPPSTATVGTAYNFTCTATGSPAPIFSVLPGGALPSGLTISSSGVISGTPTTPGVYTGTIQASNGVNPAATQNFSITVYSTYAYWVSLYGLTGNQALQTAVVSPDGIVNLTKYALGLNPFTTYNPGSASLPVVQIQNISGTNYLTLTFTGRATDVTYKVQATSNLTGTWSTIYTSSGVPPPGTITVQDSQAVSASLTRYMRLIVTDP